MKLEKLISRTQRINNFQKQNFQCNILNNFYLVQKFKKKDGVHDDQFCISNSLKNKNQQVGNSETFIPRRKIQTKKIATNDDKLRTKQSTVRASMKATSD